VLKVLKTANTLMTPEMNRRLRMTKPIGSVIDLGR